MNISRKISMLIVAVLMALGTCAQSRVFLLNIDDEIDATAWRYTRRAISEMQQAQPPYDLMLIRLNTYGGAVDMADSIRTALLNQSLPTVAFIDHNAASAGALIALACDSVYMSPGASMGAATVVDGQGQPMPPKYQSYWGSIMRSTAMAHGKVVAEGDSVARWRRNPDLAVKMVNPELAISFTPSEAVDSGMADGIAANIDNVLSQLNIRHPQITTFTPTLTDKILGFLGSTGVRAFLVMLIIGGLYIEMRTAGIGFAGAVATVATALYFLPMIVSGALAPWVVILFILGIVLLALEIFVIPGFGVAGVSGIFAVIASLVGAMLHTDSIGGIDWSGLRHAMCVVGMGIGMAILVVVFLVSRFGPKWLHEISSLTKEQSLDEGYIGVDMGASALIGQSGLAATDLRPSGKVEIDGQRLDATSTGAFIAAGTSVKVVKYEAAQIYVEPKGSEPSSTEIS
jgi:membrane-bound serine protease (ClpP class)